MAITSFPLATGLGAGGFPLPDPTVGMAPFAGNIFLSTGTSGTASTGEVDFTQPTFQFRVCTATLGNTWDTKATVQYTKGQTEDTTGFIWDNNGVALTTNASYAIHYICL